MALKFLARHSLKARITLATLAIFVTGIWSLAFYASRMLHDDLQRHLGEQQFSAVAVIAADINQELNDRLRALEKVAGGVIPAKLGDAAGMRTLLEERPILQSLFNGGVMAFRLDGTAIAEFPLSAGRIGGNYMDIDSVAAALKEGKATIGVPVVGKKLRVPVFGMAAPMHDARGKVSGALGGVVDLSKPNFLTEITENRYGKTGGYLLVAPQRRLIITASDPTRVMETLPAPGLNPKVDRFVQGYEGSDVLVNPRGVEVLVSAKRIPVAGWSAVAVLPTADAFAPIHDMQQRLLIATAVLSLLAGVLTWWMLEYQLSPMLSAVKTLASQAGTDQPVQPLPVEREDEIGQLVGGFNGLLETLGQRELGLRESDALNEFLLNTIPFPMDIVDAEGNILYMSGLMQRLIGRPGVGERCWRVYRDDQQQCRNCPLKRPIQLGKTTTLESSGVFGGRVFEVQHTGMVFQGREAIMEVFIDITERKRTESALMESEYQYRNLFERATEGILLKDITGCVTRDETGAREFNWSVVEGTGYQECNREAARMFGLTREEMLVHDVTRLMPERQPDGQLSRKFSEESIMAALDGKPWHFEWKALRADGVPFDMEVNISSIEMRGRTYLLSLIRDITERKRLEEALLQRKTELQELYRSLERIREEERHRLARELHDDLGQRVTALRMDLDWLESRLPQATSAVRARIVSINVQIDELADSIRRLTEDMRPGMLSTLGLVAAVEDYLDKFATRTEIRCELTASHDEIKVGDKAGIGIFRIVQEALNNVLKHAEATRIWMTLRLVDDSIILTIQDNGIGLPEAVNTGKKGFGVLGMRERASILNGRFTINGRPGEGVRIEVAIPV